MFTIVDELCEFSPTLTEDRFFDHYDVDIPYNDKSEEFRSSHLGSATKMYVFIIIYVEELEADSSKSKSVNK